MAESQFDKMTDEDWEATLTNLSQQKAWEEMWRLVTDVPVKWSVRLLMKLKETDWQPPEGAEREEFTQLTRLAQECHKAERLFLGSLMRCQKILKGHTAQIHCVAISPDGKILASGSRDHTVRLWNLPDGSPLNTLEGHMSEVVSLAFGAYGKLLASGGMNYNDLIQLWSLPDGTPLCRVERRGGTLHDLTISLDGKILATRSLNGTMRLWNLLDGSVHRVWDEEKSVECVASSPDGRLLVSGHHDGSVRLWSLPDGVILHTLKGHAASVHALAISSDSTLLASGSNNGTVQVWNLRDRTKLHTLELPDNVWGLAFSPDGQILSGWASAERIVRLWRLSDGKVLHSLKNSGPIVFNHDKEKQLLFSTDHFRNIRIWSLELADMNRLRAESTDMQNLRQVHEVLQQPNISKSEKGWLGFLFNLIRRHLAVRTINVLPTF